MIASVSLFLDFNLPNATTWFYFSFLLTVALFFKFSRVFSVRNFDIIVLFLLVPGLLLIQSSRPSPVVTYNHPAVQISALLGQGSGLGVGPTSAVSSLAAFSLEGQQTFEAARWQWFGYLWLLCVSGLLFARCLFDLALVQRPALGPNLTFGGLAWMAIALMGCLSAVAFRQQQQERAPSPLPTKQEGVQSPSAPVGTESAPITMWRRWMEPARWMTRGFAVAGHLMVVLGLMMIGRVYYKDPNAGMAAAAFYLIIPYTGLYVAQIHHVWPAALIVWAVLAHPWPMLAGAILGVASGVFYFPAVLVPLWLSFYWGRGSGRFALSFFLSTLLCAFVVGLVYYWNGNLSAILDEAWKDAAWQAWKIPSDESFWTGVHWAYRIPVFILYVAFLLATVFWPSPKTLAHLLALSAALLIGVQFWYADRGLMYVLWYMPLLLLLTFRPNLEDRRAYPIDVGKDWLVRSRRWMTSWIRRAPKSPEWTSTP